MAKRLALDVSRFEQNYQRLSNEISDASEGRAAIVVVSKYLSPADCTTLRNNDYGPLGENRAAELEEKVNASEDRDGWHFIGHLQRNKIREVVPRISLLHSVDSDRLAKNLNDWVDAYSPEPLNVLAQVNISAEKSKGGLEVSTALSSLRLWPEHYPNLRLRGLMTMAPNVDPEDCRPIFRGLRNLREELLDSGSDFPDDLPELSMGMSQDYRVAIDEGATLVRLGRILYS